MMDQFDQKSTRVKIHTKLHRAQPFQVSRIPTLHWYPRIAPSSGEKVIEWTQQRHVSRRPSLWCPPGVLWCPPGVPLAHGPRSFAG